MASKVYLVQQTLCKQRTVMLSAASKLEAEQLAKDGYGEVIEQDSKLRLLVQEAKEAKD